MDFLTITFLFLALLLNSALASLHDRQVVGASVQTSSGLIVGHAAPQVPEVWEYLGIPFAIPPVGQLRFAAPQTYNGTGTFNALSYSPACPQARSTINYTELSAENFTLAGAASVGSYSITPTTTIPFDEDCLTLNIWTRSQTDERLKAVIFFVYGGGFSGGLTDNPLTSGKFLADSEDVVVVSANYRVNVFGFTGIPGLDQNVGLLDQRLAIEWVRDNISGFGGDPLRITIIGSSAGSASVDFYSYAWTEDPIVSGFIESSGTVTSFQYPLSNNLDAWYDVISAVGCGNSSNGVMETVACARTRSWQSLVDALPSGGISLGPFSPTIDNKTVFSAQEYDQRNAHGNFIHKPHLGGNNDYEAGLFKVSLAESGVTLPDNIWDLFNLAVFTCPTRTAAETRAVHGDLTFRYRYFGYFPNTELSISPPSLAYHGSELPMIFGTSTTRGGPDTIAEAAIKKSIMGAWATFAKDPANGLSEAPYSWPNYSQPGSNLVRLAYNNQTSATFVSSLVYDGLCPNVDALVKYIGGVGNLAAVASNLTSLLQKFNLTTTLGSGGSISGGSSGGSSTSSSGYVFPVRADPGHRLIACAGPHCLDHWEFPV